MRASRLTKPHLSGALARLPSQFGITLSSRVCAGSLTRKSLTSFLYSWLSRMTRPFWSSRAKAIGAESTTDSISCFWLRTMLSRRRISVMSPVHAQEVRGLALAVDDRRDVQFGEIAFAALPDVEQLAGPRSLGGQFAPHRLVQLGRGGVIGENGFVLADDFVGGIAGDAGRRPRWQRECWPWDR